MQRNKLIWPLKLVHQNYLCNRLKRMQRALNEQCVRRQSDLTLQGFCRLLFECACNQINIVLTSHQRCPRKEAVSLTKKWRLKMIWSTKNMVSLLDFLLHFGIYFFLLTKFCKFVQRPCGWIQSPLITLCNHIYYSNYWLQIHLFWHYKLQFW